ncbi:SHOCT domain-containing protein [Salinisphaera aquimarina]|uniref:SHOCT domain-containing protein n=1 Tax=Salinisphaera aquimarina TaxID=2094031 RepID=A0ABV7EPY3_9GAMM
MSRLLPAAQPHIDALAERYHFGTAAVTHLLTAVADGQTQMAEFDHPEFGGPGMWMAGGMLMLSRPNDHQLKARVEGLCEALGALLRAESGLVEDASIRRSSVASVSQHQSQRSSTGGAHSGQGATATSSNWPAALGTPNITGAQNGLRYAWSAETARLAIDDGRTTTLYDTADHRITGISQQQSNDRGSLTLTSQHGPVVLSALRRIDVQADPAATSAQDPIGGADPAPSARPSTPPAHDQDAVFNAIERLADLRARDLITTEEFEAKKRELLSRI